MEVLDKHGEAITALFTVVLAISTILLWLETRRISKAGERQIAVAQAAANAAENAVTESSKMLAHARDVADRDFRPWLTIDAKLSSEVGTGYSLEEGEITFFTEITCINVGKIAARSVVYLVRGIDQELLGDTEGWFDKLICDAVNASRGDCGSLIPSERHVSRRWCRISGPEEGSVWRTIPRPIRTFRVGIVAAYRGAVSDDRVFYTAKVFPVGNPNLVEFLDLIRIEDMPIEMGDVALGPVYMARTR